jgi:TetR/AcrR family transcriptional repressor of bet genes
LINRSFREFNVLVMASVIQGAIGEYTATASISGKVDLESYSAELVNLFDKAILYADSL